ncbi:MAG: ABC transporter ATP-binding protein [Rhodospirillales bacterium]
MALVDIEALRVDFGDAGRPLPAVEDFALSLDDGDVQGLVGESGSGKSVAMLALMGLLGPDARVTAGRLRLEGDDLLTQGPRARRRLLGRKMAMVFQDPIASLDPCFRIGTQIEETIARHERLTRRERRKRAVELLHSVGIPAPESRLAAFPHQLSGGMCQRVMIAIALACRPRLLIADEPTTALDVTVQAQIMDLLLDVQRRTGMALLLVSHDLALIAETTRRTSVMYAGRIVEERATAA